ncbi:hypothetical protein DS832_07645 [Bombilactobacillus bombi]|uniref:SEC10/PgrA surface exclusion domain-containing protein n=1 Tax=Bombilactobacillus bombi TaxID=1303590 RepID=A0A417Z4B2_9LACO|nr:SEC10/PgrA surface exclusion domain-containing protein [Bombilactobacillus bombi]RHW45443.1 hypothetical protein DS832_07645 [Bombilactobacillus bombi]
MTKKTNSIIIAAALAASVGTVTISNSHAAILKSSDKTNQNLLSNKSIATNKVQNTNTDPAIEQAQEKVNQASHKVDEAQKIKGEATPTAIHDAQTATDNQQEKVTAAANDVQIAKSEQTVAQTNVNNSQKTATEADQAVKDQSNKVNEAQNKVNQAQAAVDNSHLENVQKELEQAKQIVQQDNDGITQQNKVITQDQQKVEQANKDLIQLQNQQKAAQAVWNTANTTAQTTQSQEDQAKKIRDAAQAHLDELQTQMNGINSNHIILPAGYLEALQNFIKSPTTANSDKLLQISKPGILSYVGNDYDKTIKVDPNNLTINQIKELSDFALKLINQVREQAGQPDLILNQTAIDFAQAVAKEYRDNNNSGLNGHYVAGIVKAAGEFGLDDSGNYYEDKGSTYGYGFTEFNMDYLKSEIFDHIVNMLFNDAENGNEWGHARSFLNMMNYDSN